MPRKLLVLLALLVIVASTERRAHATTTIKLATLAPANSAWARQFKKLADDVSNDTGGELRIDFQWNGQAGDEVLMVQKSAPVSSTRPRSRCSASHRRAWRTCFSSSFRASSQAGRSSTRRGMR